MKLLIELLEFLIDYMLPGLWYFIYPRLSTRFDMLAFLTDSNLMEFLVGYLALFYDFLVIGGVGCIVLFAFSS